MKKSIFAILLSVGSLAFFACSNDDESMSTVEIRLTDAPADYQEVNIDIQGVEVNSQEEDGGWMALDINEGVYNILEFTNGLDTLLGTIQLPAGKISQIRLKLGANNSIKIADQFIALKTPSGQQSGLKILVNTTLQAGVTYKILLDFDCARSIVSTGSGKYILKPVIRTITEATSGAIRGQVIPIESTPAVFAISGVDTVGTAFADLTTGKFLIQGLAAGSYTVSIAPKTGFQTVNKEAVAVSIGNVTDLGLVEILP